MVHIITGLGRGGAETVLYRLLAHQDRRRWPAAVISLSDRGELGAEIESLNVPVHAIGMTAGRFSLSGFRRLVRFLRDQRPDVVQTWMYHANLIGGLAARRAGIRKVMWGLHHTTLDPRRDKRHTIWTARLGGLVSRWVPDRVICCSQATYDSHLQIGYDAKRMVVIPNGYDLAMFRPDSDARVQLHAELGLTEAVQLIGMAARFHPQKDHHNLIAAARLIGARREDAHFLLCGEGVNPENGELAQWIEDAGAQDRFHLLGVRRDMPRIYAGLDVSVLASYGEGFPNVVAEGMACGTPTVATDVGDVARIVGDAGWVVPPGQPVAMADALLEALSLSDVERESLGKRARAQIMEHFSIDSMVARYEALYLSAS